MLTTTPEILSLYDKLAELTNSDAFYFKDYEVGDDIVYRVFAYRYANPAAWALPGALEARGITFMIEDERLKGIVCRPMEKFFNLNENAYTQDLDVSKVVRVMEKLDGSLVSSLILPAGRLRLKSKTSLFSDQANAATDLLYKDYNMELLDEIEALATIGYTVNMEYTAPDNRIILAYQQPGLTVLNVRHHDGRYMTIGQIKRNFRAIWANFVEGRCTDAMDAEDRERCLNPDNVRKQEGNEGYIWVMDTGQMVKLKTDWYVAKHKAKEGAFNFRYVFERAIDGNTDDLKAAVADDASATAYIKKVEDIVWPEMNKALKEVRSFWLKNKQLTRKDYAIKAKDHAGIFHMAMEAFASAERSGIMTVDIIQWASKRYDHFKELVGKPEGVITE